ncbi:MAG: glycosyltransferase [Candidatus Gastranaerophilales bacterium]|nr:glycosyltransferase [Candidatus Gastranaerophilales bacterium]
MKISVIMSVYNTDADYLRTAIESILNQSLSNFELIIVDDGSTTDVKEVIFSYKDERIKYIYQENQGLGSGRNTGIKAAKGEYITFVDADDRIDKNALEKTYNKAIENNSDILFFNWFIYDNNSKQITEYNDSVLNTFDKSDFNKYDNLFNFNNTGWAKLFKRTFLTENNLFFKEGIIFEDTEFFFRYILKTDKIDFLKESLYYYRCNVKNSIISNFGEKYADLIQIFESIEKTLIEENVFEKVKIPFYEYTIKTLYCRYKQVDKSFKKEFKKAISNYLKTFKLNRHEFAKLTWRSRLVVWFIG